MRCPTLVELPPPPLGKTGWPWTVETPQLAGEMPGGKPWPRISIVTPSYNQGQFIEETIRSVLLQGYPDLEYIIMDGGSTDGAVEIIRKYGPWLTHWQSRPDSGQAGAINNGLQYANGSVLAWINSDDFYLPGAFRTVGSAIRRKTVVVGHSVYVRSGEAHYVFTALLPRLFVSLPGAIPQHSSFWSCDIADRLDERLVCAFDFEFWYRLSRNAVKFKTVYQALACVNMHEGQKTTSPLWLDAREKDKELLARAHPRLRSKPSRTYRYALKCAQIIARSIAGPRGMHKAFSIVSADMYKVWP
jgi:glycosyltransferase involved in cell wall biosynthesis